MKIKLFLFISIVILLLSCNNNNNQLPSVVSPIKSSCSNINYSNDRVEYRKFKTKNLDVFLTCNDFMYYKSELNCVINFWNSSLNDRDIFSLNYMYSDTVNFYGKTLPKDSCIYDKKLLFKTHPDCTQLIDKEINYILITNQKVLVSFPTQILCNLDTICAFSYLIFENISNRWFITCESDSYTDINIDNHLFSEKHITFNSDEDVIIEMLVTSPYFESTTEGLFERIIENGGYGYGFWFYASPSPIRSEGIPYSETYDFKFYESYDTHMATIDYFSFDPVNFKLFLNNGDELYYDKSLLPIFKSISE